jgi:uncharacterized PurR-regulated membrane protein YhhQ (DUF165 family)
MALAVGVLPYPLTFLCTDLICELYGKARANFLVSVGLGLNFFILSVLTLGNDACPCPRGHAALAGHTAGEPGVAAER